MYASGPSTVVITSAIFWPSCVIIFRIPSCLLHKHKLGFCYQEISWFQLKGRVGIPMTIKLFYFSFLQQQVDKKTFVVGGHFLMGVCQHIFLTLEECKWILKYCFSQCIVLTACRCLHEDASFITFKQSTTFSGDLRIFIDRSIFYRTTFNFKMFIFDVYNKFI